MQGIAVIVALIAIGYGFGSGGLAGAITGFVAVVGIGSGLAIARAESGTGVATSGATRSAQRAGGIVAAGACLIGAYYGGWRFGWIWAVVGYAAGVAIASLLRFLMSVLHTADVHPADRSATAGTIPSRFDLDDVLHVTMIDVIREKYSVVLAGEGHPYAQCMYRPASLLPYPREAIKAALEALLDFIEGRRDSVCLEAGMRTPQAADTVRTALLSLDDFLDLPAAELPTEPNENLRAGLSFQNRA